MTTAGSIRDENFYDHRDAIAKAIADDKYPSPPARDLYFVCKGQPQKQLVKAFMKWILNARPKIRPGSRVYRPGPRQDFPGPDQNRPVNGHTTQRRFPMKRKNIILTLAVLPAAYFRHLLER